MIIAQYFLYYTPVCKSNARIDHHHVCLNRTDTNSNYLHRINRKLFETPT